MFPKRKRFSTPREQKTTEIEKKNVEKIREKEKKSLSVHSLFGKNIGVSGEHLEPAISVRLVMLLTQCCSQIKLLLQKNSKTTVKPLRSCLTMSKWISDLAFEAVLEAYTSSLT